MSDRCGHVADMPETGDELVAASAGEALDMPCIRCGVCCSMYQVRISKAEGMRIATHMGLDFYDWVGRFCEPRWPDPRSYLVRQEHGCCVFLQRQDDERFALCSIYGVRPSACRDWAAGPYKPACVEGLMLLWGVTVDDEGRFVGVEEDVEVVREMVRLISV